MKERSYASFLWWDVLLPLAAVGSPWALALVMPNDLRLAELLSFLIVPIVVAVIRTQVGYQQLREACGETPEVGRQVLLAAAILCLLFFDAVSSAVQWAAAAPLEVWVALAGVYAVYFGLMYLATRSPSIAVPQAE